MNDEMKRLYEKIAALEKTIQEQQKEIDELKKVVKYITSNKGTTGAGDVLYL